MIGDKDGFDWIIRRLKFHEGMVLKPYRCPVGKITIGVGRNIEDNPFSEEEKKAIGDWKRGITENAAYILLRNDIKRCIAQLKKEVDFFPKLDLERQYALLDMCFQLGIGGLLKFKNMLKWIRLRQWKKAAEECLRSEYAKQTQARAKRIARIIGEGIWLRD